MMFAGLLVLILTVGSMAQRLAGGDGGGRLAGTWDTVVSIRNCETGDVLSTFQSTGSFHQGGTFSGITSGTPPPLRSPEAGVWAHDLGDSYSFRFKAYLFNATGAPVAYQIITHAIELDKDNLNYVSAGTVKIYNMTGMQIGAGCSSAVGTRMVLD